VIWRKSAGRTSQLIPSARTSPVDLPARPGRGLQHGSDRCRLTVFSIPRARQTALLASFLLLFHELLGNLQNSLSRQKRNHPVNHEGQSFFVDFHKITSAHRIISAFCHRLWSGGFIPGIDTMEISGCHETGCNSSRAAAHRSL